MADTLEQKLAWLEDQRRKDADQPGPRIRRPADDLNLHRRLARSVGPGLDPAQAQAVGIGMLHRLDHPADGKGRQRGGRVLDPFHFQSQEAAHFSRL